MSDLTLSVIIPAHNERSNLPRVLATLKAMTEGPDEIIVVDNASTDDTTALIQHDFPDIKIISEPKKGIAFARSTGFNAATGDIIARLDADTVPAPAWAREVRRAFTNDLHLSAISGLYAIDEISPKNRFWGRSIVRLFRASHEKHLGVKPFLYGGNFALRRSVWQAIQPFLHDADPFVNEDLDVTLAVRQYGAPMRFSPGMLAKTKMLRSLQPTKIRRYQHNDSYTLALYNRENATLN